MRPFLFGLLVSAVAIFGQYAVAGDGGILGKGQFCNDSDYGLCVQCPELGTTENPDGWYRLDPGKKTDPERDYDFAYISGSTYVYKVYSGFTCWATNDPWYPQPTISVWQLGVTTRDLDDPEIAYLQGSYPMHGAEWLDPCPGQIDIIANPGGGGGGLGD